MPGLQLREVSKRYGATPAVTELNLEVGDGEIVSLLGPSGCGKSTTLRLVAGFEAPDAGVVRIGETDVSSGQGGVFTPPNKRDIGLVFQSYALWPHMTVESNVAYGLRARKWAKDRIPGRVREALRLVHMGEYADRYPSELSGGQQQRIALARAVAYDPSVLLLDEPLSNLDAKLRERMRLDVRELQQRLGLTALYVTHDQAEAMSMSDRVALMSDGRLHQIGPPEEIYRSPATTFVARFIGTSNLVDGAALEAARPGTRVQVRLGEGSVVTGRPTTDVTRDGLVAVCLRAESIRLAPPSAEGSAEGSGDRGVQWHEGRVVTAGFFGETREYLVDALGSELQVRTPVDQRFTPGSPVRLGFDAEDAIVIGR